MKYHFGKVTTGNRRVCKLKGRLETKGRCAGLQMLNNNAVMFEDGIGVGWMMFIFSLSGTSLGGAMVVLWCCYGAAFGGRASLLRSAMEQRGFPAMVATLTESFTSFLLFFFSSAGLVSSGSLFSFASLDCFYSLAGG
jgi:hypothetical protein